MRYHAGALLCCLVGLGGLAALGCSAPTAVGACVAMSRAKPQSKSDGDHLPLVRCKKYGCQSDQSITYWLRAPCPVAAQQFKALDIPRCALAPLPACAT